MIPFPLYTYTAHIPPRIQSYFTRTLYRIVAQATSYDPTTDLYAQRLLYDYAPCIIIPLSTASPFF